MSTYRATAVNNQGCLFRFTFENPNWNGIREAADAAMRDAIDKDALHKRNGPWVCTDIDLNT